MDKRQHPRGGDHGKPKGEGRGESKQNAAGGRKRNGEEENLQRAGGDARVLQNSGSALVIDV